MVALLGEAALRTLFVAACLQFGLTVCRVRKPLLRLVAWSVVLAASLLMPAMQWALPIQLAVLPNVHDIVLTEVASVSLPASAWPLTAQGPADGIEAQTIPVAWLDALYLLVAGILLIRLTVGVALALRLLGRAEPVQPDWGGATRIRVSPDILTPVTVANVILLPLDAVGWPAPMRDAVLAHERAHIDRMDFAMLLAAQFNQAVFWFSPFSWWLHRRLAVLAELASDDQAVAATGDRLGYAEVLLEMGRRSAPLLHGLAMARPATLPNRIERVLSEQASRASPSPVQRVTLTASAAGLAIVAAMSRPVPSLPLDLVAPRVGVSLAKPLQPAMSLDPNVDRSELSTAEPMLVTTASVVPQISSQSSSIESPTSTPNQRALGGTPQIGVREAARHVPPSLPMRSAVQQARALRAPAANVLKSNGKLLIAASLIPPSNEGPGRAGSVRPTEQEARASFSPGRATDAELLAPKGGEEPSCTGVYLPKPENPRLEAQADLIQTNYFQPAHGTPWLKLLFGSRNQVWLNGYNVERTSVRATVVALLPKDASRIAGSSRGTFGSIDYECVRPSARL